MVSRKIENLERALRCAVHEGARRSFAETSDQEMTRFRHDRPGRDKGFVESQQGPLRLRMVPIPGVGERKPEARIRQNHRCFRRRLVVRYSLCRSARSAGPEPLATNPDA